MITIEAIARAICLADNVAPDRECYGLGTQMPMGVRYPAWQARIRQAEAVMQLIIEDRLQADDR